MRYASSTSPSSRARRTRTHAGDRKRVCARAVPSRSRRGAPRRRARAARPVRGRARRERRPAAVLLLAYFSTAEKRDGLERTLSGADVLISNFLELLIDSHRMPVLPAIQASFESSGNARTGCSRSRSRAPSSSATPPSRRSASGSASRPARRWRSPARSTPTSLAASSCASAIRSSMLRSAAASNNYAKRSSAPPRTRDRKEP